MVSSPIGARREAVIVRLQGLLDRQRTHKSIFGTPHVEVRGEIPLAKGLPAAEVWLRCRCLVQRQAIRSAGPDWDPRCHRRRP